MLLSLCRSVTGGTLLGDSDGEIVFSQRNRERNIFDVPLGLQDTEPLEHEVFHGRTHVAGLELRLETSQQFVNFRAGERRHFRHPVLAVSFASRHVNILAIVRRASSAKHGNPEFFWNGGNRPKTKRYTKCSAALRRV